ncbi:unnamed protein product [Camellia sinensis]
MGFGGFDLETRESERGIMTRRCSYCSHNGHNSRTCPNPGVKLFGVRLTDGSIRKSASMGNLTHDTGSSSGNLQNGLAGNNHDSPGDTPDHGAAAGDGHASEDFCFRVVVQSGKKERREEMAKALQLPIIDLASPDRISTANSIRQACIECGFFYLINHGVEQELLKQVFDESKRFFSLPLEEKMKLLHRENRGYTPLYAENLNPSSSSKGGSKESFYIGPLESVSSHSNLNHWPSEEVLPSWRPTIESYYERVLTAGKNWGELGLSDEEIFGASAHSDYGMITFLATDGVAGLQVCRDKSKQPLVWEDVDHINGALIVNIGDMTERWTNCLFRSTLHRVMSTGRERYSMAFFLNPSADCVVECLESCCSELTPPSMGMFCSLRELRLIGHDVMQISTGPQWRLPGREVQAYIWFIGLSLKASCLEKAEYL